MMRKSSRSWWCSKVPDAGISPAIFPLLQHADRSSPGWSFSALVALASVHISGVKTGLKQMWRLARSEFVMLRFERRQTETRGHWRFGSFCRPKVVDVLLFLVITLSASSVSALGQWRFETTGTSILGETMAAIVAIDRFGNGMLRLGCEDRQMKNIIFSVTLMDKPASHETSELELQADGQGKRKISVSKTPEMSKFYRAAARFRPESSEYRYISEDFLGAKQFVSLWIGDEEYKFSADHLKAATTQLEAHCMWREAGRSGSPSSNSGIATTPSIPSSSSAAGQLTVPLSRPDLTPPANSTVANQTKSSSSLKNDHISMARRQIQLGNIAAARAILDEVEDGGAKFVLAETYDPEVLRSWGVVGTKPDVNRANALYREAAKLGSSAAAERLRTGIAVGLSRP